MRRMSKVQYIKTYSDTSRCSLIYSNADIALTDHLTKSSTQEKCCESCVSCNFAVWAWHSSSPFKILLLANANEPMSTALLPGNWLNPSSHHSLYCFVIPYILFCLMTKFQCDIKKFSVTSRTFIQTMIGQIVMCTVYTWGTYASLHQSSIICTLQLTTMVVKAKFQQHRPQMVQRRFIMNVLNEFQLAKILDIRFYEACTKK